MNKQQLINYLEGNGNYNFTYSGQTVAELESILEDFVADELDYDEDAVVERLSILHNMNY